MTDTKQDPHALLSASGSERWIGCPASVAMEFGVEDETSEYAAEGITAHKLASDVLDFRKKGEIGTNPFDLCSDDEMVTSIDSYLWYLNRFMGEGNYLYWEQKVDFSNAVINGYGTADAIGIDTESKSLHIIDLKYGFNRVEAENNTQMLLYAVGAINFLNSNHPNLPEIKTVTLHIVQPRIMAFDSWSLTIEELQDWIKYFQVQSVKALTLTNQFNPSTTNCKYCKEKQRCPALNKFVDNMAIELKERMDGGNLFTNSMPTKTQMSNDFIKKILDNSGLIKQYLKLVDDTAKERLIHGEEIEGYKLVRGLSRRKISHHDELRLHHNYGDKVYRKTLLTLAELDKVIGKKNLDFYTHKSEGGLELVKASDKRLSEHEMIKFDNVT